MILRAVERGIKRMFALAIRAGKLLQRPYIPVLAEDNVRSGFFERAQFEAIRNRLAPTYQGLVTLAYYTGSVFDRYDITSEEDLAEAFPIPDESSLPQPPAHRASRSTRLWLEYTRLNR